MKNAICVKYWCDWDMLKKLVSKKSAKVMALVEYKDMTEDAMGIMRKMAGPLTIAEVDTFISDELLGELKL